MTSYNSNDRSKNIKNTKIKTGHGNTNDSSNHNNNDKSNLDETATKAVPRIIIKMIKIKIAYLRW